MHFTVCSRKWWGSMAGLALAAPALSQDSDLYQLETLAPQALVTAVVAQSHQLLALDAAVEAARFRVEPASARPDPMLSYTLWPNSIGSNIGTRQGSQLSQSFRWPGKRELKDTMADQHASMAFEGREAARLRVIAAAKSAFSEWHYLHRALEINASNQALLLELIRVAETRYAAGQGLQQDVLQAELERATSKATLTSAIVEGASRRIRPMLMTGLASIIGLIPVMLSTGTGADVMKRIAAPMVGGVVSALVTILIVFPAIYSIWRARLGTDRRIESPASPV